MTASSPTSFAGPSDADTHFIRRLKQGLQDLTPAACAPAMTLAGVPAGDRHARGLTDGLARLSVGIEDVDDITADLDQALEGV